MALHWVVAVVVAVGVFYHLEELRQRIVHGVAFHTKIIPKRLSVACRASLEQLFVVEGTYLYGVQP